MASLVTAYLKLIKRLFPLHPQSSSIGLELCPSACKAVELSFKNGAFELSRWSIEPLTANDDPSVLAALGKVLPAPGASAGPRAVVASVSGKGTLVRYVDMPRMSTQDLRRAFAIESDKYFPFPKDTVYTDCYILETTDSNRKMSVLVAAVKKDLVDGRLKVLKDAGVEPLTVSLSSVAVANAFVAFPPAGFASGAGAREFKACAVVDIGEAGTNLMMVFAGLPRFNRDIFIGTQEIYKRLSNLLGIPLAEAGALLRPGAGVSEAASKGVDAVMTSLIAEIRLSFEYFVTEKNLAITQVFLAGDGAQIPGVEEAFRAALDIPVEIWDPFARMNTAPGVEKAGLKAVSSRLITALGLALNEYDQG
ncbi:MAG: type IV pilus assembly protein PilM [Candidatus Omnitrophica bacterium]|nr:type IV pilus assembly protein PilM [Candidatus Omnitrophota bacterium]